MKKGLTPIVALIGCVALASCGRHHKSKSSSEAASDDMVDATVTVETDDSAALMLGDFYLANTTLSYSASIGGCASGYTKNIAQSDSTVQVPVGDSNCVAKLAPVTVTYADGSIVTFTIDSGFSFAQGAAFVALDGGTGKRMVLKVTSQLPSPIVAGSTPAITYTLQFLDSGSTSATAAAVGAGFSVLVDNPISLQIAKADLTVNSTTAVGSGDFKLSMNCMSVVGSDKKCDSYAIGEFQTKLAIDTYVDGSGNARELTQAECTALANAGTKPAAAAIYTQGGNTDIPNGGFVITAVGPGAMCDTANKKLVLGANNTAGGSCKYWRVTVQCP